jgi:dimethylamine/trimethylamine dehydrogenase
MSAYDLLFEPIRLGPKTAPNRFYQVPHCSGMGRKRPHMVAAMRGMKAEGGWGVVCTEYCSIHPTSDDDPFSPSHIWNDGDVRALALMTDAVHEHGSLAGCELMIGGSFTGNLTTRLIPISSANHPGRHSTMDPIQTRRADKDDIRNIRRWHADAARRAQRAGFDIVYVYAAHGYFLTEFLSEQLNDRTDEYGGSVDNRTRLVRELIEETREATKGELAVACRFSFAIPNAGVYHSAEDSRAQFDRLADLPDLWDITVDDYAVEMGSSRFVKEAAEREVVAYAKQQSSKPVVAVGRFTSPDTMVRVIKDGVQDMIGAARPSIADPFLPTKIRDGRLDEIRECIGCNICYAQDTLGVPIRCTQNPTMGEEFRRGWHPERMEPSPDPASVLVVGAGPAGLEAALTAARRGHTVQVAEAGTALGGRLVRETRLADLSEWIRVRDWRETQLRPLTNVDIFLDSRMDASTIVDLAPRHVILATGAVWRTDGVGRHRTAPFDGWTHPGVRSVEAVLDGDVGDGPVLIYDDDHYYMAASLALRLAEQGRTVRLATPTGRPSTWTGVTNEQDQTVAALAAAGVDILTNRILEGFDGAAARLSCALGGAATDCAAGTLIPVTQRTPVDTLYHDLTADRARLKAAGIETVVRAGDCDAPGTIAAAVYAGHKSARLLDTEDDPREDAMRVT